MTAHVPVLLEQVLNYLVKNENKNKKFIVDGTFGSGGHTNAIADFLIDGKVVAFDWDSETLKSNCNNIRKNVILINDNFNNITKRLNELNIFSIDGLLLDLGISSVQLSDDSRGFSFRSDGLLDMRFNKEQNLNAFKIINNYSSKQIADILYSYGEEYNSRKIANKIVYARQKKEIDNVQNLVSIIASCFANKKKQHPARKTFQALRIYINNELENLDKTLKQAIKLLNKKGRIVIISYHSLEDRIVKLFFKEQQKSGNFTIITKRPIIPDNEEVSINNRSRSAKMRVIEKN